MFYSDTLLSKTGPLARVWLASNMERKLTKKDCLTSNLENSIEVMVDQGAAPMALRLSGQLLLGVVRIYNRKARYLLEDCNEALVKIKMVRPSSMQNSANLSRRFDPARLTSSAATSRHQQSRSTVTW
jgi:cohesin complex subunit SCC1